MTSNFEWKCRAFICNANRIFYISLEIGMRERILVLRLFHGFKFAPVVACWQQRPWPVRDTGERSPQKRPESSSSSCVPSSRTWWWHKHAGRAKDVNTRAAIFWYFVRRLTSRTLRYYRPALILGTRQSCALLLLSAACTGNSDSPRATMRWQGGVPLPK